MQTPLRTLRKARGLSLQHVADAVGADTGNLSRIERIEQYPSRELAASLAKFFGPPLDELQVMYPERYMQETGEACTPAACQ